MVQGTCKRDSLHHSSRNICAGLKTQYAWRDNLKVRALHIEYSIALPDTSQTAYLAACGGAPPSGFPLVAAAPAFTSSAIGPLLKRDRSWSGELLPPHPPNATRDRPIRRSAESFAFLVERELITKFPLETK